MARRNIYSCGEARGAGTGAQALIQQYAVPILEEQPVFGTDDETRTAYLDTQVCRRLPMSSHSLHLTLWRSQNRAL